jgi:tRNA nucleotidyltransferase (CCA-adding enzyme)
VTAVARRAHLYPQVEPGAAALVTVPAVPLAPGATVAAALALVRRRGATVLVADGARVVLGEDVERARELALGALPAHALARPVPVVAPRASEVAVRRHLADGATAVLVRDRAAIAGAVLPPSVPPPGAMPAMRHRLARLPHAVRCVLGEVRRAAAAAGIRAWLVGGAVRDLLRDVDIVTPDLDVAVEGDGPQLAAALARALGGRLVVHDRFRTAAVQTPAGGTIDVVTARGERYDRPGALPRVMPGGIDRDLRRRDFTVNAMAIELTADDGGLLDPLGGRADLAARRLRVIHPLSFVEDPTRIFRAARYAARLGFAIDAWTRGCRRLALALAPYPALSGARLVAELDAIARDAHPEIALTELGRARVFTLLDRRYRFTARTRGHARALPAAVAWSGERGLGASRVELAVVSLLADQRLDVVTAALDRLALRGAPRARIEGAVDALARVPRTLAAARTPSRRARVLRALSPLSLATLWLSGQRQTRAALEWWQSTGCRVTPALGGDDLIRLGVSRGPDVAGVRAALSDARLDGRVTDREAEAEWVRRWIMTRKEG